MDVPSQPLEAFQALEGKDKEAGLDLCGASHQEFITTGNLEQRLANVEKYLKIGGLLFKLDRLGHHFLSFFLLPPCPLTSTLERVEAWEVPTRKKILHPLSINPHPSQANLPQLHVHEIYISIDVMKIRTSKLFFNPSPIPTETKPTGRFMDDRFTTTDKPRLLPQSSSHGLGRTAMNAKACLHD